MFRKFQKMTKKFWMRIPDRRTKYDAVSSGLDMTDTVHTEREYVKPCHILSLLIKKSLVSFSSFERQSSVCSTLPGGGHRLQTCGSVEAQQFDSAWRTTFLHRLRHPAHWCNQYLMKTLLLKG